jgi:fatty-acyl-CoA synthase
VRSTLRAEFDHALSVNLDRVAVQWPGGRLTFSDVDRWATIMAHQMRANGVAQGDVVALYTHNCAEFVVADVAVARLGAVKMPINYMLPLDSVSHILQTGKAKVVVVDERLAGQTIDLLKSASLEAVTVLQIPREDSPGLVEGAHWLDSLHNGNAEPFDYSKFPLASDDRAALYFTGGTTGKPKGVVHTQASLVAFHYAQMLEAEILQGERLLLMTPLAHAAGLFAQSALIRGATSYLTDGFHAEEAVELLAKEEITWTFLVPTMIYRVLDELSQKPVDDLHLRTVVYGAAPISAKRLEQALHLLGGVFIQLYGQTEMPNWGTRLAKSDHDLSRPALLASCGRASIMADVKVVDDDGNTVDVDATGEICLRSPYVLAEYIDNPKATAEKFLDGWIRTGDIGAMDGDGYLYLRDRKNDMIISGGMNVYSREVEDALSRHPMVKAVAVIGVPHEDWGEAVHAVVIPGSDELDPQGLLAWVRDKLASYARPKSIEFVDALPETAFGKIDKKALRSPYWIENSRGIS